MAAIDSLLRLLASQNADALIVSTNQAPKLLRAGAPQPLSMPPISPPMMETFLSEVLSAEQLAALAPDAPLGAAYADFDVTAKRTASGHSLAFKRRPKKPASATAPAAMTPAPAPVLAPALAPALTPPPAPAFAAASPAPGGSSPLLDSWIASTLSASASDLLISAGLGARLRVAGHIRPLHGDPPDDAALLSLFAASLSPAHHAALAAAGATDFAYVHVSPTGHASRFRANLFRHHRGLAIALRPIRSSPPPLAELSLPASLTRLTAFSSGLVLVVGPTGSGKTTTLASLVDELLHRTARHVITIEDPIEFELAPTRGLVHQRELGTHTATFALGLTAALREAPDVILVGEMRDRDTIAAAITAAETGHLVLSTLHAASAAMAIDRVVDVFPEHQQRQVRAQLAGCLRAILTQHLIPTTSGDSRVPAVELLLNTPAVGTLVREGRTHQLASTIQTGRDDGMIPLDRSLAERVLAGEISAESAAPLTADGGLQLRELLRRRA